MKDKTATNTAWKLLKKSFLNMLYMCLYMTFIISTSIQWFRFKTLWQIRWASLNQQRMTGITNPYWLWWRRQRQFVVRASVTENFPTVSTVVLLMGEEIKRKKIWIKSHICTKSFGFTYSTSLTFLLESENSFSQSLQCVASLSFNQTSP